MNRMIRYILISSPLLIITPIAAADLLPTFIISGNAEKPEIVTSLSDGPLRADNEGFKVQIDNQSLRKYVEETAKPTLVREFEDYYRESRGFRNLKLTVQLEYEGSKDNETFSIDLDKDNTFELTPKGILTYYYFRISGEQDIYKCFDASTCVKSHTDEKTLYVRRDDSTLLKRFDSVFSCNEGEVTLQRQIGDDKTVKFLFDNKEAQQYLEMSYNGYYISNGQYVGSENLDNFEIKESFRGFDKVYKHYSIEQEFDGLKIQLTKAPYFYCQFSRYTGSYPSYMNLETPIGAKCTQVQGWVVWGDKPGNDFEEKKDWFFRGCKEV